MDSMDNDVVICRGCGRIIEGSQPAIFSGGSMMHASCKK